jgi:two-component system response regulator HydG
VLMTGFASLDTAVEAIKLGARDYLTKPIDFARLDALLAGIREETERRRSVLAIETDLARRLEFEGMIGRGPAMQELFSMIRRLAPHLRTALITGEIGTGKELVARALHGTGPRRVGPFLAANCATVLETLFESELFGHVRGAFPGAIEERAGLFELGDGGTVFLDEIGELPPTAQARLLRVLENGEVHRLGSLQPLTIDVHVIAATSRDLRMEVTSGKFRSDLYYRLNIVDLRLPPLRERREDIPYLTASFVRDAADRLRKPLLGLTPAAERILIDAAWDGNVRELRNVIERACILCEHEFITEREVGMSMPRPVAEGSNGGRTTASAISTSSDVDALATIERDHIQRALLRSGGNKKAAAQMLGLSRRALYRRLERLNLAGTISRRREEVLNAEC